MIDNPTIEKTDAAIVFSATDDENKGKIQLLLPESVYECDKASSYNCLMAVAIAELLSSGDKDFLKIVGKKIDEVLELTNDSPSEDCESIPKS